MGSGRWGFGRSPRIRQVPVSLCLSPQDQHLILGAEEGIFILNRNEQEATLEMVKDASQGGPRAGLELGVAAV